MYCPKTALSFCSEPISREASAEWCRRQHKRSSEMCNGCKVGIEYGVVEVVVEKKPPVMTQGVLF